MSSTKAVISLGAITRNMNSLKQRLPEKTRVMAVVKANAYGHGALRVAKTALKAGAAYLAVAQSEEGVFLRERGVDAPILVLGGMLPSEMSVPVAYDLTCTVYSPEMAFAVQGSCEEQQKTARVHIKIETGMNRIGVRPGADLAQLLDALRQCPSLSVEGMFSHFAVADSDEEDPYTARQTELFLQAARQVREAGFSPMLHLDNSAAALYGKGEGLDMVRFGIGLYGLEPAGGQLDILTPALAWKTAVTHLHVVQPGETVSYGRHFTAQAPTLIATLPVGYADGYRRSFSPDGQVLVHGVRAPIVGIICMDQCMADVTHIPDMKVGDEVVLIGRQGNDEITAAEVADWAHTIHYEIITGIGARVPRLYVD